MNTLVNDLFDKLNREEPEDVKEFTHVPTPLKPLDDLFKEYLTLVPEMVLAPLFLHDLALQLVLQLEAPVCASTITAFSDYVTHAYHRPHIMAPFLNSLCYASQDQIYTLRLHQQLRYVGYQNWKKHLRVIGDVGKEAGAWMAGGSLTIIGNAGNELGQCMREGRILVSGNVAEDAGKRMEAGSIYIRGNAGAEVGKEMKGGRIHIRGNVDTNAGQFAEGGELLIDGCAIDSVSDILQATREQGRIRYRGKWYGSKVHE